jgi:hypothetical protein
VDEAHLEEEVIGAASAIGSVAPPKCQVCGARAQTMKVDLHRNIGLLVIRLGARMNGWLCKACIRRTFWKFTLVNVTLGWWGFISIILTPVFIIGNTIQYIKSLGMSDGLPLPAAGAGAPPLAPGTAAAPADPAPADAGAPPAAPPAAPAA